MSQYHKDCTNEIVELISSPEWKKAEKIFKHIDWPNTCKNNTTVTKRNVMLRFHYDAKMAREVGSKMKTLLWHHLFDAVSGLGDDGYGDLCWHIVSLGRDEILRVTYNPSLAQERADRRDFYECFAYVLPYDDDFEKMNEEHHRRRAAAALGEMVFLQANGDLKEKHKELVGEIQQKLILMMKGEWSKALEGFDRTMYDRYYKWAVDYGLHAQVSNVFSDATTWLLGKDWK